MNSFLKRYRLNYKQPSALEKSRKAASADPDVIYGFYSLLEDQLEKLGITNRPECIWNVDETNLFIEPQRAKVN